MARKPNYAYEKNAKAKAKAAKREAKRQAKLAAREDQQSDGSATETEGGIAPQVDDASDDSSPPRSD